MPEEKSFGTDFEPIARRQLPMFFMIDVSGSMEGSKIGTVDTTMRELLPELADLGEADADIRVAVLTFSSGCEWMSPAPQKPDEMVWKKLVADGVTDLGDACRELSKKMSRKEFLSSPGSTFAPIVILLTDGEPTDDYKKGLEVLWGNNWFKNALRFALPILSSGSNLSDKVRSVLSEFTGNPEAVLKNVTNAAQLKKMLKVVSVTSAAIGSRSSATGEGESEEGSSKKLAAVVDEIQRAEDEPVSPEFFPGGDDGGVDADSVSYDDDQW